MGWHEHAKCRGMDPRLFDLVDRREDSQRAARLCAGCPVIVDCAQDALKHRDSAIIRAGIPLYGAGASGHGRIRDHRAALKAVINREKGRK